MTEQAAAAEARSETLINKPGREALGEHRLGERVREAHLSSHRSYGCVHDRPEKRSPRRNKNFEWR